MSIPLHVILLCLNIYWSSCVTIHRMSPSQEDLNVCLNPQYQKTEAVSLKPRVLIKALLYKSPPGKDNGSKRKSKVSAGVDLQRKIIVIIKFTNRGKTALEEEYIVVDHVTDQKTKASYRLLNPLVFKAKQNQIKQMYPLKSVRNINWSPYEEVINKNNKKFQGCSTGTPGATCGIQYDSNNQPVEYSEGFCCSCDAYVNMNRQPADLSPEFIHLPLESGDERFKRNSDRVLDNLRKDLSDSQVEFSNSDTCVGSLCSSDELNEEQEELTCRAVNVWTRRVLMDLKDSNKRSSNLSQIRRKKEIGKHFFDKAQSAFKSVKSKTLQQFSNLHLNELFEGKSQTEIKNSSTSTKYYNNNEKLHSYPNYITIPGFETAYGFTSNDTTHLNPVVDPWDTSLKGDQSQDGEKNRYFFHALGEIQSIKLNSTRYSSDEMTRSKECSSKCSDNTSEMEIHTKGFVTRKDFTVNFTDSNVNSSIDSNKTFHKRDGFFDVKDVGLKKKDGECQTHLLDKTLKKRAVTEPCDINLHDSEITVSNSSNKSCHISLDVFNISKCNVIVPGSSLYNAISDTVVNNTTNGLDTFMTAKFETTAESGRINIETNNIATNNIINESNNIITNNIINASKFLDGSTLKGKYTYNSSKKVKNLALERTTSNLNKNVSSDVVGNESITLAENIDKASPNYADPTVSNTMGNITKVITGKNAIILTDSEKTTKSTPENSYHYLTSHEIDSFKKYSSNETLQLLSDNYAARNKDMVNDMDDKISSNKTLQLISENCETHSEDIVNDNSNKMSSNKTLQETDKCETPHSEDIANDITNKMSSNKTLQRTDKCETPPSEDIASDNTNKMSCNKTLQETDKCETPHSEDIANDITNKMSSNKTLQRTDKCETPPSEDIANENTNKMSSNKTSQETDKCETPHSEDIANENTNKMSSNKTLQETDKCETPHSEDIANDITNKMSSNKTLQRTDTCEIPPSEDIASDNTNKMSCNKTLQWTDKCETTHSVDIASDNTNKMSCNKTLQWTDKCETTHSVDIASDNTNKMSSNKTLQRTYKCETPHSEDIANDNTNKLFSSNTLQAKNNSETQNGDIVIDNDDKMSTNETLQLSNDCPTHNEDNAIDDNDKMSSNNTLQLTNNSETHNGEIAIDKMSSNKTLQSSDNCATHNVDHASENNNKMSSNNTSQSTNNSETHNGEIAIDNDNITSSSNALESSDNCRTHNEDTVHDWDILMSRTNETDSDYNARDKKQKNRDNEACNDSENCLLKNDVHSNESLATLPEPDTMSNITNFTFATHTVVYENCSLVHFVHVNEKNPTDKEYFNENTSHYQIIIVQPEVNKALSIEPATEYSLEEVDEMNMRTTNSPIISNLSQPMYDLYILSNLSQSDVLPTKENITKSVDKKSGNKCSKQKCTKGKSGISRYLSNFLKQKTAVCKCPSKRRKKTDTNNSLKKLRENSLGSRNNSSINEKYIQILKRYMNKKFAKRKRPIHGRVKPLGVENKKMGNKYTCLHVGTDTVITESSCRTKSVKREVLNKTDKDADTMKLETFSIEKGYSRSSTIDSHSELDMEFSNDDMRDSLDLNHLKLKQDVIHTLLDFVQDESRIQKYNEMKLHSNRSLLKREVERLENDIVRNLLQHEPYANNTSRDVRNLVKRQITSSGIQVRGGQSCVDRVVPSYVSDPDSYHESAHCLRYSDIWYTLYKLRVPYIEHSLEMNIFEKHYVHKNVNHWSQLSKGMPTRLSTSRRRASNKNSKCPNCPSIFINYLPLENNRKGPFSLKSDSKYLLAPQHDCLHCSNIHGGPGEYMLVSADDITPEGDICNKIGVSYKAFATQPMRCAQPRGTCLGQQISDLWHFDKKAKSAKKPGKYFLENFATVSNDAHYVNFTTHEDYLALEYLGSYASAVELEIDNHFHTVVKVGESASISEVHIDATCKVHTKLGILVTNHGLTSAQFGVNLTECPLELRSHCARIGNKPVTIYPQQRKIFRMSLNGDLPLDQFSLLVQVTNGKQQLVASRKIQVEKLDRCFCVHHCECSCTGSMSGLQCELLPVHDYHEAGFIGSLPEDSDMRYDDYSHLLSSLLSAPNVNTFVVQGAHFIVVFLLLGVAKAIVGYSCLDYVGNYGIWMLICERARCLTEYLEPELRDEQVIYDELGYPIHPQYMTRSVRYIPQSKQFLLNIFFYFLLVLVVLKNIILNYFYLLLDVLGCCWGPDPNETPQKQDRMRGGGSKQENFQEAENYIENANREVLEKLYSGREDSDSPVPCYAVNSDGILEIQSYQIDSQGRRLHQDVMSEPSKKN